VAALFAALGRAEETARLDGRHADLLNHSTYAVSAWDGPTLVGAARVRSDYQHHGIGGELLRRAPGRPGWG
jgi:hypothetical protein